MSDMHMISSLPYWSLITFFINTNYVNQKYSESCLDIDRFVSIVSIVAVFMDDDVDD